MLAAAGFSTSRGLQQSFPSTTRGSRHKEPTKRDQLGPVILCLAPALCRGIRQPLGHRRRLLQAAEETPQVWDQDLEGLSEDSWNDVQGPTTGKINTFADGASLQQAKMFQATRKRAVAAWSEDVKPKPIFAVSDATGQIAKDLAETAFQQFGDMKKAIVTVVPNVRTEQDVRRVVAEAANLAPEDALTIEQAGALIIFSFSSQRLSEYLMDFSAQNGVPCINGMESALIAMEKAFSVKRCLQATDEPEAEPRSLSFAFSVSDSSADIAYALTCKALQQFPTCSVASITLCPNIRSTQEINHVVEEAKGNGGFVVYCMASPGMSRYIRQQCERTKVPYADIFQPVVVQFESYLDYPPLGVPGGHSSESDISIQELQSKWLHQPLKAAEAAGDELK